MTTIRRTAKFTASVEAAKIAALLGAPTQPVAAPAKAAKATKAEKEQRQVLVLKRAVVKRASSSGYAVNPGDIVNLVRNGGGRVYTTILRRNKKHTCTCEGNAKWHKQCYHIDHCVAQENARWQAERDAAKKAAAIAAEQTMIAKATRENKAIEASRVAAEARLIEAGKVVAEAAIATEAKRLRESEEAKRAAAALAPINLQDYRRRKKSTEDAMMAAPLTKNSGFSLWR